MEGGGIRRNLIRLVDSDLSINVTLKSSEPHPEKLTRYGSLVLYRYTNVVESLHVLFTLFIEFKNNPHFGAASNQADWVAQV